MPPANHRDEPGDSHSTGNALSNGGDGAAPGDSGGRIDWRLVVMVGIAVMLAIFTFRIAGPVLMPILIALLLSVLLAPVVNALSNFIRLPPALGAALVLAVLLGVAGYGVYRLAGPAARWMETLPSELRRVEYKLRDLKEPIERVRKATESVEELTNGDNGGGLKVDIQQQPLSTVLLNRTGSVLVSGFLVIALLYFLLASGDSFLHKLVKSQTGLHQKKRAVEIVRETKREMSVYLLTISATNVVLGMAIALAMYLLGMPNPVLWGVMATVLNFIPYLGAVVGILVVALVAAASYDHAGMYALVPATYFLLTALEGYVITPLILGVRLTLSPVAIFISLMFFSWMWGVPGALLSVPLLAMAKLVSDRVEPLHSFGRFLGR